MLAIPRSVYIINTLNNTTGERDGRIWKQVQGFGNVRLPGLRPLRKNQPYPQRWPIKRIWRTFIVGVICASKLLRQRHMGKSYKVSPAAVVSMGQRAKRGDIVELVAA